MQEDHPLRLTASEISSVWNSYINNSFSVCVMKYFLENVEDPEVEAILNDSLDISQKYLNMSKEILKKGNQPIPVGFTDNDVSPTSPRLYSDTFYLYYIKNMTKVGLSIYGVALSTSAQSNVRELLSQATQSSLELYNKAASTLLSKGLFIRTPFISTSDNVDFIDKKSYLSGLLKFNHRPLNTNEITHLSANLETNGIGATLLTGFSQVAKSKKVRDFCLRGKEISKKHVQLFSSTLTEDDIPAPTPWDLEVTDSTVTPFSDKLIMFHTVFLVVSSISNYATASATSLRTDIIAAYVRLTAEVSQYSKDGADLMIKNEWMEQPPQAPNHKNLAKD